MGNSEEADVTVSWKGQRMMQVACCNIYENESSLQKALLK
jgi:hypothetical protein